jgi:hypothetical protein
VGPGLIVPVFKAGGNPALVDDYRPITIGSLPAKILADCLNTRLSGWAEGGGKRAQGQAGFRAERRCADNVLVLRTMIELQRYAARGLYCCSVDFKKAYDCIPRDKLWAKMRRAGHEARPPGPGAAGDGRLRAWHAPRGGAALLAHAVVLEMGRFAKLIASF